MKTAYDHFLYYEMKPISQVSIERLENIASFHGAILTFDRHQWTKLRLNKSLKRAEPPHS